MAASSARGERSPFDSDTCPAIASPLKRSTTVVSPFDEAQNLTPHEVKTIITRAGDGTKIILTGDPYQIDNPYIDSSNNGLTTVVERFKGEAIAGHITLSKGERSELAELATQLL